MKNVTSYLMMPMNTGVYRLSYELDLTCMKDFLAEITKIVKKQSKAESDSSKSRLQELQLLTERWDDAFILDENCFEYIRRALHIYALIGNAPRQIVLLGLATEYPAGDEEEAEFEGFNPFEPTKLLPYLDVAWIEKDNASGGWATWFVEVITLTHTGMKSYKEFMGQIPILKGHMKTRYEKKTFSSRYALRPYPLAVSLWLNSGYAATIPKDLRSFLSGALTYHLNREWRTSIILSAIEAESLMADIYEETHRSPAPNVPLGDLFQRVKSKFTFPDEVSDAIEQTNEARIAAVHRSRFSVSDRDSLIALSGATRLTVWYFSESGS